MTQVASAPLPALISYYNRLDADPNQPVAKFGFSREKIHFQLVLERDGAVAAFEDIRDTTDRGKRTFRLLIVPDGGGRSGTGVKPFFCWDNTGYVLGRDNKGKPKRAEEMFAAFRQLHLSLRDQVGDDDGYTALCLFLERWDPSQTQKLLNFDEAAGLNVVFKLRGREGFVHQSEAVKRVWLRRIAAEASAGEARRSISLLSGEEEQIARLHPLISGVADANTTGAAIVSFNLDAFESYGKDQSYNAPVGVRDVFRYTTALNRLLADDNRRVRIGDATVVFWTDREQAKRAEEIFRQIFGEDVPDEEPAEHGKTVDRLRAFLKAAQCGRLSDHVSDPEAPFYILGLSPNASRLNVRYWLAGTVEQFAQRLAQHAKDLEMIGARPDDPPLVIRRLLLETAREPKDIPPQLGGDLARAVLGGLPYPQALFTAVIRRIRADATMNHRRAAILKAYLVRNRRQEVPMALDKNHPDEAYHLGRLFAALEYAQSNALGEINRTIKDGYFGAASATPASVFPRLMRLHPHHVEKLPMDPEEARREKKRTKGFFERLVQEICGNIQTFPAHLPLEKQGLFQIAYYHQRQDFFTKKSDNGKETTNE